MTTITPAIALKNLKAVLTKYMPLLNAEDRAEVIAYMEKKLGEDKQRSGGP